MNNSKEEFSPEDFGLQFEDSTKREKRFAKQRQKQGWDDSETWNLDQTLAQWLLPRLKRFREINQALIDEEFIKDLDKMIYAFDIISDGRHVPGSDNCIEKDENAKRFVEQGLEALRNRYFHLWW